MALEMRASSLCLHQESPGGPPRGSEPGCKRTGSLSECRQVLDVNREKTYFLLLPDHCQITADMSPLCPASSTLNR
jgi:hypothetical protein